MLLLKQALPIHWIVLNFYTGMGRTFYLTENTMIDDYTPADPQFLTVCSRWSNSKC